MIHLKRKDSLNLTCWMEIPNTSKPDLWEVVAECKIIDGGDTFLIDEIFTKPGHRRKGYASLIVQKLQTIKPVLPAGIVSTEEANGFWNKLGLRDALGDERTDYTKTVEQLLLECGEFDFKIQEVG